MTEQRIPTIQPQFMRMQSTAPAAQIVTPEKPMVPFYVPTIDISPFLQNPKSAESARILSEVKAACESTGFFQILNHGVPVSLQDSLFNAAKQFFELPYDEKVKLDAKKMTGHRGYDLLASQSYEEGVLPDLKEGFYIGNDIPATDPRTLSKRFYMGPNVWPDASLLPHKTLKEPAEAYFKAVYDLSLQVLNMIFATLPTNASNLLTKFTDPDLVAAPLRLLHYPPARKTETPQRGASAHTDFGAITLLLQDGNPGLEVLDQNTDTWVPIEPNRNSYVVNVGDMLEMWSGGRFKSSMHRVINKKPTDRYSVVFFFDGNLDCSLSPLDGSNPSDKVLTVEQHMLNRMAKSYGVKKI
ncbi:Clavaminate synthase-like protein [Delitschia confertaspora ATCC 74209]|uniref:Clavaminate synthase-like protein n=1 Tax=Delitschia confertaspora ATCC 74209 TaxID=1513339 RepID=A0A9P4JZN3_9PLEO|nr:Clavaminate synthase-like protein [Delitschia confertaspora ATCC 74209]